MDLLELNNFRGNRHPWELARRNTIKKILAPHLARRPLTALDIGCGDGYMSASVFSGLEASVALSDLHMPTSMVGERIEGKTRFRFMRGMETLGEEKFSMVIAMDVIEHVEDDAGFLAGLVKGRLADDGLMFITVPAFQSLFCGFDVYIRHQRRYSLSQIRRLAEGAGLEVISGGYISFSSLVQRLSVITLSRLGYPVDWTDSINSWNGGAASTWLFETILSMDDAFLLFAARNGITLPGLTAWLTLKKKPYGPA